MDNGDDIRLNFNTGGSSSNSCEKIGSDDSILKKNKLHRHINLPHSISIIVGSVIGSGIFVTIRGVLLGTGSIGLSLIIWILAGIYSIIGALCYAELNSRLSCVSGGDYAYLLNIFGDFWAFVRLYGDAFIIRPTGAAVCALGISYHLLDPWYATTSMICNPPLILVKLLSIFIIIFLGMINCYKSQWALRLQTCSTIMKLLALVVIMAVGIYVVVQRDEPTTNYSMFWNNSETNIAKISMSFYSALFAYHSWHFLNTVSEEIENPRRNIPIAITLSLTIVCFCYVGTVLTYYTLLTPQQIFYSEAVAVTFMMKVCRPIAFTLPIAVAFSALGSANGQLFTAARLFFIGSRHNHMPQMMAMLQKDRNTPIPGIIAVSLISCLYLACVPKIEDLINYTGIATWFPILLTVIGLLKLKIKERNHEKYNFHKSDSSLFTVPIILPIIYICLSVIVLGVSAFADWRQAVIGIIFTFSGIPFYMFLVKKPFDLKWLKSMTTCISHWNQKIFILHHSPYEIEDM